MIRCHHGEPPGWAWMFATFTGRHLRQAFKHHHDTSNHLSIELVHRPLSMFYYKVTKGKVRCLGRHRYVDGMLLSGVLSGQGEVVSDCACVVLIRGILKCLGGV